MNFKPKKIIFDFGCNNGQNLQYFLEKAQIVVCVEANLFLIEKIKTKFDKYIKNNSLFIENVSLSEINGFKDFYISKESDHASTLIAPENYKKYIKITVPSLTPSNLIKKYINKLSIKEIEYIKIDLEGYDHIILDDLFKNNIFPKYISCEVHNYMVINLILNSPYKSFKFIEGCEIGNSIKKVEFLNHRQEVTIINFAPHSSGPYGDDIPGLYYSKDSIINYFLINGLGWKDICCSLEIKEYNERIKYNLNVNHQGFKYHLKKIFPSFINMIKLKIINLKNKYFQ